MPLAVFRLKRLLQSFAPNLVIVIQGGIEVSSLALLAARRAKLKVVSYIPLAHKLSDTSFKLGWIRDFVNKYFFQIPDAFITVSPSMKRMLVETRNVKVPIIVVWNGINLSKLVFHDKHKWRQQYNIAPHEYVVAIMGRIYFKQKGHDFLVNSIRIHQAKMKNIRFLIIGDGPDSIELRRLIQEYELNHVITVLPWNNDLSYIYSGVDAVTIPSRYEGLPLVMLEAMYYKLPIIASDIDVMSDLLPEIWLFKLGDSDSFVETLLHVKNNNWSTQLLINHESIINNFNSEMFVKSFQQAVCDVWLDKVE
jgi:glycosyltransferase involved in cell wall biosynthesis